MRIGPSNAKLSFARALMPGHDGMNVNAIPYFKPQYDAQGLLYLIEASFPKHKGYA